MNAKPPLVFACSGCSNAGQLANQVALELDRREVAEMSCLAGIGAGKQHFLKKLRNREVWIVDGCPIECALGIFHLLRDHIDLHIRLHDMGIRKSDPLPRDKELDAFVDMVLEYIDAKKKNAATHEQLIA